MGVWAMPASLILVLVYIILCIAAGRQLVLMGREKFKSGRRNILVAFMVVLLTLTLFNPSGLINFGKRAGEDILIAWREGAANCTTTLKLKENHTFIEKSVCFGITEIKGKYILRNDTIFFTDVETGRGGEEYYQFARIVPAVWKNDSNMFDVLRYMDINDTLSEKWLRIVKNNMKTID